MLIILPILFFPLQITPAGYTFIIWGFIYTWQAIYLFYVWTFVCRPQMQSTIFTGVYIGHSVVYGTTLIWLYVWGNLEIVAACVIIILINIAFYPTIGMLVVYLDRVKSQANKIDVVLTRIIPLNGFCFNATWTTIASLINLTGALEYRGGVDAQDAATISLSLLLVTLVVYFVLENTILDRYLRYVLSVYPVVIWALGGVLSIHWGQEEEERNSRFVLALLIIACLMLLARIALLILFTIFRPINDRKSKKQTIV